jgi:hypothetical protein
VDNLVTLCLDQIDGDRLHCAATSKAWGGSKKRSSANREDYFFHHRKRDINKEIKTSI